MSLPIVTVRAAGLRRHPVAVSPVDLIAVAMGLALALAAAGTVRGQAADWAGKQVVAKSREFILRQGDQVRSQSFAADFVYRVEQRDGDVLTLKVDGRSQRGWTLA
jgi:hypothetical protein